MKLSILMIINFDDISRFDIKMKNELQKLRVNFPKLLLYILIALKLLIVKASPKIYFRTRPAVPL